MNVRVAIAPPCADGATSEIFGTVVATTLPTRQTAGPKGS